MILCSIYIYLYIYHGMFHLKIINVYCKYKSCSLIGFWIFRANVFKIRPIIICTDNFSNSEVQHCIVFNRFVDRNVEDMFYFITLYTINPQLYTLHYLLLCSSVIISYISVVNRNTCVKRILLHN